MIFKENIIWQIGDGNIVNFWLDKWGPNNNSLISLATNSYMDTTLLVRDVMSSSCNWDQNFLFDNLPNNIAEKGVSSPCSF